MKKVIWSILVLLVISVSVLLVIHKLNNEKEPDDINYTINEVVGAHASVEISDIENPKQEESLAKVKITMPDICAIYADLVSYGSVDQMTLEDIEAAIAEYIHNDKFMCSSTITATVQKDGSTWVLATNGCVDELVNKQIELLLIEMINGIGTIEIGGKTE